MEEEKCPIDNKCPIILECDKKNIIAELQAENKKQAERIEQLEEPLKAANFKVDGMLAVGQELINLKQRIKELEKENERLREVIYRANQEYKKVRHEKCLIEKALKGE